MTIDFDNARVKDCVQCQFPTSRNSHKILVGCNRSYVFERFRNWTISQTNRISPQDTWCYKSLSLLTVGDVVRIQPNHISFNSLEAVEAIHGVRTKATKGDVYHYVMRFESSTPLTLFSEMYNGPQKEQTDEQ
jgi:hypothetical protein